MYLLRVFSKVLSVPRVDDIFKIFSQYFQDIFTIFSGYFHDIFTMIESCHLLHFSLLHPKSRVVKTSRKYRENILKISLTRGKLKLSKTLEVSESLSFLILHHHFRLNSKLLIPRGPVWSFQTNSQLFIQRDQNTSAGDRDQ